MEHLFQAANGSGVSNVAVLIIGFCLLVRDGLRKNLRKKGA